MARKKKTANLTIFPGKVALLHDHLINMANTNDDKGVFIYFTLDDDGVPAVSYNLNPLNDPQAAAILMPYIATFFMELQKKAKKALDASE